MTLRHFDSEVDLARKDGRTTTTVIVRESVAVTARPSEGRTHLLAPSAAWGWEELRDYVVQQIEARFGAFPRNFKTEHSIFKSFATRWGQQAGPIAVHAFEVLNGFWAGAPISVNRFCKNSDVYFAAEIAQKL